MRPARIPMHTCSRPCAQRARTSTMPTRCAMVSAVSQRIEKIRPPLRHLDTLVPMCSAVISGSHLVRIAMGKSAFNCVGRPLSGLVEQRTGHRAKTVGGHFVSGKAKSAQTGVDCVLTHRAFRRPDRREYIAGRSGNLLDLAKQRDRLPRQWHLVRPAHLHLLGRDRPDRSIEVDLVPFGVPQFAGADKDVRQELHGKFGQLLTVIAVDCTEQFANLVCLDDRTIVLWLRRDKRAAKIAGRMRNDPRGRRKTRPVSCSTRRAV